jgi:sugar phosphate isomerase/epimerase
MHTPPLFRNRKLKIVNQISLNCSTFVGKQYSYGSDSDWGSCVDAVNQYYSPLATFPERFEQLVLHVKTLGFDALDIWTPGQLSWRWATDGHISTAHHLLEQHDMAVTSIGGEFGATRDEFVAACRLAVGVDTKLLSGTVPLLFSDRAFLVAKLEEFDLKLAIENHPEKTPEEMLAKIDDTGHGRIGTAVDTGWYATQGYDGVQAIEKLKDHILHVHLKDVLQPTQPDEHINCGYGNGCVPLEEIVSKLDKIQYTGDYSVENHAFDHDPTREVEEARKWLEERLRT